MTGIALLPPGHDSDQVAWRNGAGITRARFLQDVSALMRRLPSSSYVLNHCDDRYHFLVGLTATMMRGQVSLFPSSRAPQVLEELKHEYPDLYCLTDSPEEGVAMEVFVYPGDAEPDPSAAIEVPVFPASQQVAIAFTSGSTGKPKRYPKFWGGIVHESRVAGRRLGLDVERGGYAVATVPPQHMFGFVYSVILPLQHKYAIEAQRPFYPEDIRQALESFPRPGVLVTTPVHVRACVLEKVNLPPMEFILSSTAPLDADLAAQAEHRFGAPLIEFYGSSETGAIASRRHADGEVWEVFDDIRVGLDDAGFRVDASYLPEPVVLSDSVEICNEYQFILFGRNSDLIKIGGKRISLGDLNRQLLDIEGVRDGTFFLPDTEGFRETRLAAFVVAPGRTRVQILEALRRRIDPVFLPRPLRLVSALPRNATGKLPRGKLVQLMQDEKESEAAD
ncbi:MAG: AMP-binding protein [Acidiferrobacterales bacterium]